MKPVSSPYKLAIYFTVSAIATVLLVPFIYIVFESSAENGEGECVVLMHGLNRTGNSMALMEKHLNKKGYSTVNTTYDSNDKTIREIADSDVKDSVTKCMTEKPSKVHFVTHSMGGIVVRKYLQENSVPKGSRIVMLGPPNKGSELSDYFMDLAMFKWINGDAGLSLTTDKDSIPNTLKPVPVEVGVIAGTISFNPFFSYILPDADDGKVTVERTRLPEMTDFKVVNTSHTFMMMNPVVMNEVLSFLETGKFTHEKNNIDELTSKLSAFESDGCSLSPDGNFLSTSKQQQNLWCGCCFRHDISYWQGGTSEERLEADKTFKQCIKESTGSEELSLLMYNAVRAGGSSMYPTWYRWGYGWPYGRGDKALTEMEKEAVSIRMLEFYQKDLPYICLK